MIYHYTSIDALHSIFSSIGPLSNMDDEHLERFLFFRASAALSMNDPTESQLVPNAFKRLEVSVDDIRSISLFNGIEYIASFSMKDDDLTMWRCYGSDGKGVAIGFNEEVIMDVWSECGIMAKLSWFGECEYVDENDIDEYIRSNPNYEEYMNDKSNHLPLLHLYNECMRFKHKAFRDEEEYRIIVQDVFSNGSFAKNGRIVPYVNVPFPVRALRTIVVGPRVDFDYSIFAISQVLKNQLDGYLMHYPALESPSFFLHSSVPYK